MEISTIMNLKTARMKAEAFLNAETTEERQPLKDELDAYRGDPTAVVEPLKPKPPKRKVKTGWTVERPFRSPKFKRKHSGEILTVHVPKDYDPRKKRGLLIFLHGGGNNTPRHAPTFVCKPDYGIRDLLEGCGRIVCAPCCPYDERSFASWNLPAAEAFIFDVIEEMENGYAIDPDDVVLVGQSMGGLGAYHYAQRLPDRFHGVFAGAGAWDFAHWPSSIGSTVWIRQGINDAVMFKRRHGTDVEFARLAKKRLDECGVANVYRENSGAHGINTGRVDLWDFLRWANGNRRDPFHPRVVAATPRGCTPWIDWKRHKRPLAANQNHIDFHELPPCPHNRWVTVDGVGDETIIYDMLEMKPCRDDVEEDWNDFELKLRRKHIRGAVVEAAIRGDGVIEVVAQNATGFTLWLHPKMVDLKNVRVIVNGVERFKGAVKPGLGTLLESYLRRRDWGLLYPAKISIQGDESWQTRDQLKVRV